MVFVVFNVQLLALQRCFPDKRFGMSGAVFGGFLWRSGDLSVSLQLLMEMNEYQQQALKTAIYSEDGRAVYAALGLTGEAGEVADKIKKVLRDHGGVFDMACKWEIVKELGDVLWYLSLMAHDLGFTLDDVAQMNLDKINSRQLRGRIHGTGDDR